MAIEYQPSGYGSAVQSAATSAGASSAANKIMDMAAQMAEGDRQRRFQLNLQNMQEQSLLQRLQLQESMELEAEKRRQLFEIEKMEIRSRIDFQEDEKRRAIKKQQYDSDLQALDKALKDGTITEDTYSTYKRLRVAKEMQIEQGAIQAEKPLSQSQMMAKLMKDKLVSGGMAPDKAEAAANATFGATSTGSQSTQTAKPAIEKPVMAFDGNNVIKMTSDGQTQTIPISAGKHYVGINPNTGAKVSIPAEQVGTAVTEMGLIVQGEDNRITAPVTTTPVTPTDTTQLPKFDENRVYDPSTNKWETKTEKRIPTQEDILKSFATSTGDRTQEVDVANLIVKNLFGNTQPLSRDQINKNFYGMEPGAPERIGSEPTEVGNLLAQLFPNGIEKLSAEEVKKMMSTYIKSEPVSEKELVDMGTAPVKEPVMEEGIAKRNLKTKVQARLGRTLNAHEAAVLYGYFSKNAGPYLTNKRINELASELAKLFTRRQ